MTATRSHLHPFTLGPVGRARHTLVAAAVATALGVFSAPAAMAQSASAADLQNLQDQVQKLQREIDRMKAQQTNPTPAQPQSPGPYVSSPKDSAQAATAPSPSFMAGPIKITPGGFV
jgi:hypothetical protein